MTTNSHCSLLKNITLAGISTLLIACGGSETGTDGLSLNLDSSSSTTVAGSAVKGVVENGIVRAYLISESAGFYERSTSAIGNAVRTDVDGNYSITLPTDIGMSSIVIELTSDNLTRMTCDVTEGCGDDAEGTPISFGQKYAVGNDFVLSAALTNVSPGAEVSAHLTPLSHMAVAYAASNSNGISNSSIRNAYSYVENLMELDNGTLDLTPPNLADLSAYSSLSKSQVELAIISAAFQALANTSEWDSIVDVIEEAADSMATSGQIVSNSTEENTISLDELFLEATELAVDLAEDESNASYSSVLATVGTETMEAYESAAVEEPEPVQVVITQQPSSANIEEGQSVLFEVGATGGSLSFQWRKDGQNILGATGPTYAINTAELDDAGVYDVAITNEYETETSLAALLQVSEEEVEVIQVVITDQPDSANIIEGQSVEFSVSATGGSLAYQWRKDGLNISGATSPTYSINAANPSDAGNYTVAITNEFETETSSTATLSVTEVITVVITDQPDSADIEEGQNVEFSVVAEGGALTYQWRKDGEAILGATSSSYSISGAELADAGSYDVTVTNAFESRTSSAAVLGVTEPDVGLATLNVEWSIPATRVDGSALELSEIDGYVIAYGEDIDNLTEIVEIDGASSSSTTILDLTPSTYYVSVATVDADGVESDFSEPVSFEVL